MKEKGISAIIITIIILMGIGGLYIIYDATYGKSIAGTRGFLEATHHMELAKKALELEIDEDAEIDKIYDLLREGKRICITLVNTRTLAIQQEYIRYSYQVASILDMTEIKSVKLGPTWKIVNVDEFPCKPLEQILQVKKPILA